MSKTQWIVWLALCVTLSLAACPGTEPPQVKPPPAASPQLKLLLPEGDVVTGRVMVLLEQQNTAFRPEDVQEVVFEFSCDGGDSWSEIRTISGIDDNTESLDPNRWQALWDTDTVPSGGCLLRARMSYRVGDEVLEASTVRDLTVNQPPIIEAVMVVRGEVAGEVLFDGSAASDPDGQVTSWRWDFGDPEVNADARLLEDGRMAVARYRDLSRTYAVILTVADDRGAEASDYSLISFEDQGTNPPPVLIRNNTCICNSIKVRTSGNALGPDGRADANGWARIADKRDGLKLGPLNGNPENKTAGGEKKWTGFSFEVVADVTGDPKDCRETQLIKRTITIAGGSTINKTYSGTGDRDLNGTNDMNITDKASCVAAGGSWNDTTRKCEFPQSGTKFQPDGYTPSGGSSYDREQTFKKHQGAKALWHDAPGIAVSSNGSTYKADFIAILRGTDGKYCYVKFSVDLGKKAGADKESISPNPNASGEIVGTSGAASVPGVP